MTDSAKICLQLGPQIGEGTSGIVYPVLSDTSGSILCAREIYVRAHDNSSEFTGNKFVSEVPVVAKEVKLEQDNREAVLKEVDLLKICSQNCRGIVQYVFSGMTIGDDPSLIVVMGACAGELWTSITAFKKRGYSKSISGVNLKPGMSRQGTGLTISTTSSQSGLVSRLPTETERLSWTKSLCETISDCHKLGLLHRDINPWNVLISAEKAQDGTRKLCLTDFGLSARIEAEVGLSGLESEGAVPLDDSALGSLYSAPELGKRYGLPADIFSVGMMLLAIWSTPDVRSEDALIECVESVKQSAIDASEPPNDALRGMREGVDAELRTIVMSMVSSQPHVRPTAAQACEKVSQWLAKRTSTEQKEAPEALADEKPEVAQKQGWMARCCRCFR